MPTSWKVSYFAPRDVVQPALLALDATADWDPDIVVTGFEVAEDRPEDWVLSAYLPRKPTQFDRGALDGLFLRRAPKAEVEELPDEDWVTVSQEGVDPIHAGRFYVRTPDHPPHTDPALIDFIIPASQAFGTGQHETTAGCLAMLDAMKRQGVLARNCADIGTGTGLLAFAAMRLWPGMVATASDIDPVCLPVVEDNAATNRILLGARAGELTMIIADGMDHPLIEARGPYDLLIANILAGPLVDLAPGFDAAIAPGGNLLLAGLLTDQEPEVRRAYRRRGFRLAKRLVRGDWSILWLRKSRVR